MPLDQNNLHSGVTLPKDPSSGKFIVADILPPSRTSIHAANAAPRRQPRRVEKPHEQPKRRAETFDAWLDAGRAGPPVALPTRSMRSPRKPVLLAAAALAVVSAAYGVSWFLASVHISVIPTTKTHAIDHEIAVSVRPGPAAIAGEVFTLTDTREREFEATGTENVSRKASGTIIVYNAYGREPQSLVASTRFEAPDGKIYRIPKSIVVPGAAIQNGALMPSSLEVTVFADQPGPEYNRDLTDFTIPGFKGTPKFQGFYARSKTPMADGFSETASVVTQSDIDRAVDLLEREAGESLKLELAEKAPAGLSIPSEAYELTTRERKTSKNVGDPTKNFSLSLVSQGRAIAFRMEDLAAELATLLGLPRGAQKLTNPDSLTTQVVRRNIDDGMMIIRLSGEAQFQGVVDDGSLREAIRTNVHTPEDFEKVFQTFPTIERASIRFVPPWIRRVPTRPERIVIE